MSTLEVSPAEFNELQNRSIVMIPIQFEAWLREKYRERCPELDVPFAQVEVKVIGEIKVKKPRKVHKLDGWTE